MFSRISSTYRVVAFLGWLSATGAGFLCLGAYHARPGGPGAAPARWPGGCPIPLDRGRPTLLIFLHPLCPCSRASVDELASIASLDRDRFVGHAIVYRPEGASEGWGESEALGGLPAGVRRWDDPGGRLARRFGVETSGHVLLFEADGSLLFDGGITPSRGHRGGSAGREALAARIERRASGPSKGPVFGCPILEPAGTSGGMVSR